MTDYNQPCTVLAMPAPKRKVLPALVRTSRNRDLPYDETTYAGRLNLAIKAKEQMLGRKYLQSEVLADIQRSVGRKPEDTPLVSQQTLSKLQHGKQLECADTPAIAVALGVSPMWLAYGVGPASLIDDMRFRAAK